MTDAEYNALSPVRRILRRCEEAQRRLARYGEVIVSAATATEECVPACVLTDDAGTLETVRQEIDDGATLVERSDKNVPWRYAITVWYSPSAATDAPDLPPASPELEEVIF